MHTSALIFWYKTEACSLSMSLLIGVTLMTPTSIFSIELSLTLEFDPIQWDLELKRIF